MFRCRKVTALLWALVFAPALALAQGSVVFDQTSGSITTNGASCSTATNCVIFPRASRTSNGTIVISGTWTGTISFEGSLLDMTVAANQTGTTGWFALNVVAQGTSGSFVTSTTANGQWIVPMALTGIRARGSAAMTGSATVNLLATSARGPQNTGVSRLIVQSTQPAAPASGTAWWFNSNATAGNAIMAYDGTGWQSDVANATTTLYVRDARWGAKCDGTTDDAAAIQAAVNALPAKGGIIEFPRGTCVIKSQIKTPTTTISVWFRGQGFRSTTLDWQGGNSTSMIFFDSDSTGGSGGYGLGKKVTELAMTNSVNATGSIAIRYGTDVGGATTNEDFMTVQDTYITNFSYPLCVDNGSEAIIVNHNYWTGDTIPMISAFATCPAGGGTLGVIPNRTSITNNWFLEFNASAINIALGAVSSATALTITNNRIQSSLANAAGITLNRVNAFVITGNDFELTLGGATIGPGVSIGTTAVGGASLSGGLIAGNGFNFGAANAAQSAIKLDFADGVVISGNGFANVGNGITLTANTGRVQVDQQNWGTGVTTKLSGGTLPSVLPVIIDTAIGFKVLSGLTYDGATFTIAASGTSNAIQATNTSTTGSSIIRGANDGSDQVFINIYGSAAAGTVLGTTKARLGELRADGAGGLLIDTGGSTAPIVLNAGAGLPQSSTLAATGGWKIGTATGGDPGVGAVNIATADGYQVNGTALKNITETLSNKTLTTGTLAAMGTGSGTATLVAVASSQTGSVGCTNGATDDTLFSYAIPANSLSANGKGIRFTAWGTGANTATAKTLKSIFGATTTSSDALTVNQADTWYITGTILRTGAATQEAGVQSTQSGVITILDVTRTAPAETLSGAVTLKITGNCTAANDILGKALVVEMLN